ncbi:MAG: hypothetical protein JST00_25680 [Deltaproteobacteria bacterium]|nr:hypothetical protein [Deltaproteobacteria bacterium]
MRVRRCFVFLGIVGVVVSTALGGCGEASTTTPGGDVCTATPACPQAVPPSLADQQTCTNTANEPICGSQYRTMKECQTFYAKCSSTGTYSASATNAFCKDSITAYNSCRADAGIDAGCRPRTCSQAGANCGEIDNGCGAKIQCGACTNGQTCGGAGTPNRCGCGCDPTMCGTVSACNTTITCPNNCVAPQFCGGGGIANRCGCTPSGSLGPLTALSTSTASVTLEAGAASSWSSTNNARVSDNANASTTLSVGSTSGYLVTLSYDAKVPAGATIAGITVQVERSSSAGLATTDYAVRLVKGTQILSAADNKAAPGTWPVGETTVTYGGPTDLWGSTWTPAEVNAGGFGVAFAVTYTGSTGTEQARVDAVRVTVHYTGVVCN